MSENHEQQFDNLASQSERLEVWDMNNLHDFFKLLLVVDKRINPENYNNQSND